MQHKKWLGIAAVLISGMMIFSACSAAVPGGILASMRELPRVRLADAEAHPLTQAALAVLQALPPDTDLEGVRIAQAQEQTDEDASETEDQNGEMSEDELVSMGEEVYMANCETCHRAGGEGSGGYPPLGSNSFVTSEDPTQVIETVVEGRAQMPSFGDQLSAEEIAGVVSYIRTSWENNASTVTVADVSQVQDGAGAAEQEDATGQEDGAQQDMEQTAEDDQAAEDQAAEEQSDEGQAAEGQPDEGQPAAQVTMSSGPTPIVIQIQIIAGASTEGETQAATAQATPTPEATPAQATEEEATPEATPTPTAEADEADTEEPTLAEQQLAGEAEPTATPPAETDTETDGEQADEATEDVDAEGEDVEDADDTEAEDMDTEDAAEESQPSADQQEAAPAGEQQPTAAAQPNGTLPGEPEIQLVKVADGLIDPVNLAAPPDGSGRIFIVERVGRIRIVENGELLEQPFLDISDNMKIDFLEQGLLGLAFHPDYANNGRFFVYYTDWRTNGDSVLAEFQVSDDPNQADPDSVQVLLTHDQPYVNHNGGNVVFGPDGYLYLALGDGGLAGDPYRNAQNVNNLLGSILRIDVDSENRQGYTIPEDNPFMGQVLYSSLANEEAQDGDYVPDARPEIWLYGLRNPWQFSFDRATGDLYIADVGQGAWEEINFLPADSEGGQNYGWPVMEGAHCYPPDAECGQLGELPVAEYANPDDGCSITGIGVYRGEQSTNLDGIYFASDFCSGRVWGLTRDEGDAWQFAELLQTDLLVTGAGEDEAGELYLTACNCQFGRDYDPYADPGGTVWRIVAADQVPEGAETAPLRE